MSDRLQSCARQAVRRGITDDNRREAIRFYEERIEYENVGLEKMSAYSKNSPDDEFIKSQIRKKEAEITEYKEQVESLKKD